MEFQYLQYVKYMSLHTLYRNLVLFSLIHLVKHTQYPNHHLYYDAIIYNQFHTQYNLVHQIQYNYQLE